MKGEPMRKTRLCKALTNVSMVSAATLRPGDIVLLGDGHTCQYGIWPTRGLPPGTEKEVRVVCATSDGETVTAVVERFGVVCVLT